MNRLIYPSAWITALMLACTVSAAALAAEAKGDYTVVTPDALEWQEGPDFIEPGAELAVLAGNPVEGAFTARLKFPADYDIHAHEHTAHKYLTVISGTLHIGFGDELDKSDGMALEAGSFVKVPAGQHHYEWFEEETVLQVHMNEAIEVIYADPEKDPRNQ